MMKQTRALKLSVVLLAAVVAPALFTEGCRSAREQTETATKNAAANTQPSPSAAMPAPETASPSSTPAPETSPAQASPTAQPAPTATIINPSQTPTVINPSQTPTVINPSQPAPSVSTNGFPPLIIPVAGVRADQLRDTYTEARANGRTHDAIDIIAPQGTPVLAAADGKIVKLFQSVPGGITIYQLCTDNKTILYYAHLERYADGLTEGHFARQGEVIAYVGDTGNAGAGNYHLHFSVSVVSDPKRWWSGVNTNPYPLLKK